MRETTKTGIAVIESKWHSEGSQMRKNASVRPMFDMLCDLYHGSTHEYVYEMVATGAALKEAIDRLAWQGDVSTVYLAAHGNEEGLHLHGGEVVSRAKLCNLLVNAGNRRRNLSGLYLGSCEFGTDEVAKFLLDRDRQLRWVAGYRHAADFIDGTALDVMFFNSWLRRAAENKNASSRDIVENVAQDLIENCRGMINTRSENGYDEDDEDAPGMGFSIYVRAKGPTGGIIDLLREKP